MFGLAFAALPATPVRAESHEGCYSRECRDNSEDRDDREDRTPTTVPESSTLPMFASGLAALAAFAFFQRNKLTQNHQE